MRQRPQSVINHHDHHTNVVIYINAPIGREECEMLKEELGSVCQVEQRQQADAPARSAGPQTQQIEFFHYIDPNVDDEGQQAATHIGSVLDDIDFSTLTCRFNDEEVRASGIALVHARPVLAIMDRMKEDAPKIYWFGFYCVLLEKGWIKENITDFCYRMNALFGIGLDRSALNKEKTDIKTDIREWPETGSCATEKKNFALRFMAYVDFYLDYKRRQLMA